jgi:hypothetical protein
MAGKWWVRAAVAPVLMVGLVAGAWHLATSRLETEFNAWRQAREAEGWRIRHAPPTRGGFPFQAELYLRDVVVDAPSRLGWQAGHVALRLGVMPWGVLRADFAGAQALRHAGGVTPVHAEGLRLSARLPYAGMDVAADHLALPGMAAETVSGRIEGGRLELAAARVEAAGLPPVEQAGIEARVNIPLQGTAAQWQAAGGQLRVDRLEFRSGRVEAQFSGQFNLDRALQPEGYGGLSVTHAAEAVGTLSEAGLVSPDMVGPLRALVMLTSRIPPEGGPPRLDVPIELRNRRLMAARMPLVSFPALDWR